LDPVVDAVSAGTFPFGFTNPIFVDADGGGYTGIGAPQPACANVAPPGCSGGAVIAAANVPSEVMFAEAGRTMWQRLVDNLFAAAIAHEEIPPTDDEAEWLEQHERTIRRSSEDYYPLRFIQFPTPEPTPPK
jgi:hypothetical protein